MNRQISDGLKMILSPLGRVYSVVLKIRNQAYDNQWMSSESCGCPVVSIGNITLGGTGKTPLVDHLVAWGKSKNWHIGVVSRGYGGSFEGEQQVQLSVSQDLANEVGVKGKPTDFGDEPTMLAEKYSPEVPVFVGTKKIRTCRSLLEKYPKTQLIFADDAFQHRALKRDLDVVVLDLTESPENYRLIPKGRLREPLSGLSRADHLIFTKANLISTAELSKMKKLIGHFYQQLGVKMPSVSVCNYGISNVASLSAESPNRDVTVEAGSVNKILANKLNSKQQKGVFSVALASGIARPELFQKLLESEFQQVVSPLRKDLTLSVEKHFEFNDHHSYTREDILSVLLEARKLKVDAIFITTKDAIKWKSMDLDFSMVYVVEMDLRWKEGVNALYDKISRLIC